MLSIDIVKDIPKVEWNSDKDIQIEHYYRLVTSIMHKFSPPYGYDYDDMFQIGVIALIKAIKTFKPEKGIQFSTYAGRCITNEYFMEFRKSKGNPNKLMSGESLSLDYFQSESYNDEFDKTTLYDMIHSSESVEDIVFSKIALEEVLEQWEPKDKSFKECAEYFIRGKTQQEIAEIQGITQSYCSRKLAVFKRRAAAYFDIEYPTHTKKRTKSGNMSSKKRNIILYKVNSTSVKLNENDIRAQTYIPPDK